MLNRTPSDAIASAHDAAAIAAGRLPAGYARGSKSPNMISPPHFCVAAD
jgi:hypothetical protein